MHDWLYGEDSDLRNEKNIRKRLAPVKLRGIEINFTKEEVCALVREKVKNANSATNFHSWFAAIDNLRVSPKWVVSQLTGLSVGSFHSDEARRVLQQIGIEVIRQRHA